MEIKPILSALLKNTTAPVLVALQVAISLAILANALYIVQTRLALSQRPSGISDEANVFSIQLSTVKHHSFQERLAQQQQIRARLKAIPGVVAAGTVSQWPMTRNGGITGIAASRKQKESSAGVSTYATADSILPTFGVKLLAGRDFTSDDVIAVDRAEARTMPRVVHVTQEVAHLLYPNETSVIGKPLLFGTGNDAEEATIIGVIDHLQTIRAEAGNKSEYSIAYPLNAGDNDFAVRTLPGQRDRVMKEAEAALRQLIHESVVVDTSTVEKDREMRYQNDRTLAWMLISISTFLLLITVSGIVGMSTVWVAQRRKQIGVRRALGARKIDIIRYFVTENLLITGSGVLLGAMLALAVSQLLVSKLEMSKLPLSYLAGGSALLLLAGVASVFGPALRAANISPAMATRSV